MGIQIPNIWNWETFKIYTLLVSKGHCGLVVRALAFGAGGSGWIHILHILQILHILHILEDILHLNLLPIASAKNVIFWEYKSNEVSLISANNGNKRRNLMRYKILYFEVYLPLHKLTKKTEINRKMLKNGKNSKKLTKKRQFRGTPSGSWPALRSKQKLKKHVFLFIFRRFLLVSAVKSLKKL